MRTTSSITKLIVILLVVAMAGTGCAWLRNICGMNKPTVQPPPTTLATETRTPGDNLAPGNRIPGGIREKLTNLETIYFDFDKSDLRPDMRAALDRNAEALRQMFQESPSLKVVIEGYCDERGTVEYNLALGERRAQSVERYLVQRGLAASQLMTMSYGEEKPVDSGHTEEAWKKNRRAVFSAAADSLPR